MIRQHLLQRADVLRLTAVAALVVCAFMTANHLHPERAFCPLDGACAAASESALGSFYGIPTAVLGLVAFGGLFVLTLLPTIWAHRFVQPAGVLALAASLVFVAYQAYVLKAFCTLCLVADGLGFVAGAIALTWPLPAAYAWGGRLRGAGPGARVLWTSLAMLAVALPLGWPRPAQQGWVEIEPVSIVELGLESEASNDPILRLAAALDAHAQTSVDLSEEPATAASGVPEPEAAAPAPERPLPLARVGMAAILPPLIATQTPREEAPPASVARPPTPAAPPPQPVKPARKPAAVRSPSLRAPVLIVEYLNAYCGHCRATHSRLERVLRTIDVPVRRVRIYTFSSKEFPVWARACAYADATGKGDLLFNELVKASSSHPSQVYAAARRAGLDIEALKRALSDPTPPRRLVRDRKLVQRARLKVLPTLDIGRRRLLGEQSEAELRAAIRAALPGGGAG